MTTATKRVKSYMPTYDYSNLEAWSMPKEKAFAILDKANACMDAGDIDGYFEHIKKMPVPPNIALRMRDEMGKEELLAAGYNLADAEIAYGKDWLDTYMVD